MEDKRFKELASRPVGRLLWQYSIPAVVGMLVIALYNVVDRIFIGQWVGPHAIAGLAVTFPLMNLTTAVGTLVGVGAASRISIALGAGRKELAENLLGNALTLTIAGGLFYILAWFYLDPLLRLFGASDVTLPYAHEYMSIMLPGLLLTNFAFSLNNVMRSTGYPRRAMVTMMIGAAANVVLDPLFIYVFDMGIAGAAWATDIAMLCSAIFVAAHFLSPSTTIRFRPGTYRLRWHLFLSIISIGAAPAVVNAASCAINAIANNSLRSYGSDLDIAAMGIFTTYTAVIINIILGINQGMQPIVGYNYGAGQFHRLRRTYLLAVLAASILTVAGSAVAIFCPQLVSRIFTSDTGLIECTDRALRTALLAFAVVGFQIISTTFFQSIGNATKSIIVGLLRQVIFLIPLLIILPGHLGVEGVWYTFPISDLLATVVTFAMVIVTFRQISRKAASRA